MAKKILPRIDGALKNINETLKRLNNVSYKEFIESDVLPQVISFHLLQIGERMGTLCDLLSEKYPEVPWKTTRQMRNDIVHEYDEVDFKKVYHVATKELPVLKETLLRIKYDMQHVNDHSFKTERLFIRPWDDFDADELFDLAKEREIGFWCGWEPHKHIRDTMFALHNFLEMKEHYAICLKTDGTIVGCISLSFDDNNRCELGYWIGKPYWNNGYATEAAKEIIRHAFEDLIVAEIWCGRFEGNNRSKRVQDKLGFVLNYKRKYPYGLSFDAPKLQYMSVLSKDVWEKNK